MNKVYISLTGGLGNQLFQLSAAMSLIEDNEEIFLLDIFGKPRSTNGLPDICGFKLGDNIKYWKGTSAPFFLRKAVGFFLRMGLNPRGWENITFFKFLYKWILSLLVSLFFRERIDVINGRDVGYSDLRKSKKKILLVGYFQSYRYAKSLKIKSEYLQIMQSEGERNSDSISLHDNSNRLIIHLRLTDYLIEEDFGIPNQNYYEMGLKQICNLREFKEVWIFSDDIEMAKNLLEIPEKFKISWMRCEQLESYEILNLMRYGSGYIIANSTFSWWAAYMSRCDDPIVVAPNPWFRGMPSPSHLIPDNWTTVEAWR